MKISVIVPVYKAENYLEQCVKSILNQTFKDFELILVDDGSPDNCGTICEELAGADDRIVCVHKENGGASSARNMGIDIAKGEYIAFVDSDDYIAKDMLEVMYANMLKHDADISGIDYTEFSQKIPQPVTKSRIQLEKKNLEKYVLKKNRLYCAVRYLYKKSIIGNQRFDCSIELGEDQVFIFDYIQKSKSLVMSNYKGYFYRKNSVSASNGQLKNSYRVDIDNRLKIIDKLDAKTKKYGQAHYWKGVIAYWVRMAVYGAEDGCDFDAVYTKKLKDKALSLIFSCKIEFKYKAICMLICLGENNAKTILRKALMNRW